MPQSTSNRTRPPPSILSMQNWRRWTATGKEKDGAPGATRKRDLLFAFAIVTPPLLAIALILVGLVFNASDRDTPNQIKGTPELPVVNYPTSNVLYTGVDPGSFLLVGSWASNFATITIGPFMVIFSYTIAREILQELGKGDQTFNLPSPFWRKIIRHHGRCCAQQRSLLAIRNM